MLKDDSERVSRKSALGRNSCVNETIEPELKMPHTSIDRDASAAQLTIGTAEHRSDALKKIAESGATGADCPRLECATARTDFHGLPKTRHKSC